MIKVSALRVLFFPLLFATLVGCSTTDKIDPTTPEGAFKLGVKYEEDERYEEALQQFLQIKNKHPYSRYAVEAKLHIADIHFKRENWIEAQTAYQVFKELHPKHPKIAYATYQLAMSYSNQLPTTIDRDLSIADKAITYFKETETSFPSSEYAAKAKEERIKCQRMLAEKEEYIANFYFKRGDFASALGRFEDLLNKYPDVGLDASALKGAVLSARRIPDPSKAKSFYHRLQSEFADSNEAKTLKRDMGNEFQ